MKRIGSTVIFVVMALVMGFGMALAADLHVKSVTGTGSDLNVSLGYTPSYVRCMNRDNGSAIEWFDTMADDTGTVYNGSASAFGNFVQPITLNGVSAFSGNTSSPAGFSLGSYPAVNVLGNTIDCATGR